MDNTKLNNSNAYDQWHNTVHGQENLANIKLEQWHINALSLSPDLKGLKVLEVGCGVGDFAIHLSTQQAKVTAVDFSAKAIELAVQKSKLQTNSVQFQVADAQSLPFENNSFDILFSCECLEHVPDPKLVLAEFHRVLKPAGKLVLTTENYSNAMVLYWLACWLRKQPFNSGEYVQPIEHFFCYWNVRSMINISGFRVEKIIGSHHVFLMLPRLHPHTFVKEKFENPLAASVFRPLARHMAFAAVKK